MNTDDISLEEVALLYEAIGDELSMAIQHCNVAAQRFRNQEVARGSSHGFALHGRLHMAQKILDRIAQIHASKSSL